VFHHTDLFLAMFLVRLPPSMRETVGAGNHTTAAAMVKAADALWDARGGNNPTVMPAMTQRSRSPAPNNGRRGDKRGGNAAPKVASPPDPIFTCFKTLPMLSVNLTTITPIRLTGALCPVLIRKTN
jgi:hypothetical protein